MRTAPHASAARSIMVGVALLLLFGIARADHPLEIIQLRHRTAEDVLTVLRPFVATDGAISGVNDKLIVRTSPENLAQLRAILDRIDTPAKRLLVTVRQNVERSSLASDAEVGGHLQADGARISAPTYGTGGARVELRGESGVVRGRILETETREDAADTQRVQVVEGREAYIQVGQSVPVLERSVVHDYGGVSVEDSLTYKDVLRGFYVLPRVTEAGVTLDIRADRDALSTRDGGTIDTQSVQTTVHARLGEWIDIGGIVGRSASSADTWTRRTGERDDTRRAILIRVDAAP